MSDIEIIKELQKEIGKAIVKLSYRQLKNHAQSGFSTNKKGQVIGLIIRNMGLTKVSPLIFKLKNLRNIGLQGNEIKRIPKEIGQLIHLELIYMSDNKLVSVPKEIGDLKKLKGLKLFRNNIKFLPEELLKLNLEFKLKWEYEGILIFDNPLESPPLEIIKQGRNSIRDWFEANKAKLNEIKIILIGEPKAGKTSILKRLKFDTFNKDEVQTDGVNIEDIEFGSCDTFKNQNSLHNLTGHFWDFGGQEIMNATHQFFLTKRSIYVLVLDARKDVNNSSQIRQWVKRIKVTGGDSPIIVLANQIDVNPGFGFENERELQSEFPQIKSFMKVSCRTNKNIENLKNKLEELIPMSELFNSDIDERWIKIKEKLKKETKASFFLDEARFLEICDEVNLTNKREQRNAITFLHDLGQVMHFDDLNLSEYYVLDPYWITYGVYQILTSSYAGNMKGKVSMTKLEYIVNEEEDKKEIYNPSDYKKIKYSHFQRRFLIDILHQFKLCFRSVDNRYFIIPDLLDTKEPSTITDSIRMSDEKIQFVYDYEYLPKSIMPNFMVDAHHIISHIWRTGCVLINNGCKALVTNYRNRITITIIGEYKKKRDFMSVIRYLIDSINQNLSDKPIALIPLPEISAYAEYERLLTREKKGKKEYIFDEDKPTERKYQISMLLDGVPNNEEIRNAGERFMLVLNRLDGLKCDIEVIKENQEEIKAKLYDHFEYLIDLTTNKLNKEDIIDSLNEINTNQTLNISSEIMSLLASIFKDFDSEIDNKLKDIYNDLRKTEDLQTKLKLSIPFINLLGINLETEFDIKKWTNKMYKKYELKLFQLMA